MAVNFKVAAEAEVAAAAEKDQYVEVPIEGVIYKARRISLAQIVLIEQTRNDREGVDRLQYAYQFVEAMMGEAALKHIKRLVLERKIDLNDLLGGTDLNPEGGLIDQILAEFAGFPTEPSAVSSASPRTGGRRSTGRVQASTSSDSPSTDS